MFTKPQFVIVDIKHDEQHEATMALYTQIKNILPFIRKNFDVVWFSDRPRDVTRQMLAALINPRDHIFIKPDIDAWLDTAVNEQGKTCIDYLKQLNPPDIVLSGQTFYGCVLGAYQNCTQEGLKAYIAITLTDESHLDWPDHEEAEEDFEKASPRVLSHEGLIALIRFYDPKTLVWHPI